MDEARIKSLEERMEAIEERQDKVEQRVDVVEDDQSALEFLQINLSKRVDNVEGQILVQQEAILSFLGGMDKKQEKMLYAIESINSTLTTLPCKDNCQENEKEDNNE